MDEAIQIGAREEKHFDLDILDKDHETFLFINRYSEELPTQPPRPDRQLIGSHVQRRLHKNKRQRSSLFLTPLWKRYSADKSTKTFAAIAIAQKTIVQKLPAPNHKQPSKANSTPLPLSRLHGNSDPFSAAAITITPTAHQLLQFSYHWQLFLDYPVWASELYNDVAFKKQQDHIRMLLGDPAALHCLLASGYYISSQLSLGNLNALAHKTTAIGLVRQRLAADSMMNVAHAIYQLLALELFCGEYKAAARHLEALRTILTLDKSGSCINMLPHLWTSDVWLAYHLQRRTIIDIDVWDTPVVTKELEDTYLDVCQYGQSSFPDLSDIYALDHSLIEILTAIHKTSALKRWALYTNNSQSRGELVQWLHLRAASLDGRLINHLNDRIDLRGRDHSNISSLDFIQALNVGAILAAMCYLHLECTKVQYGGQGKVKIHALFEPLLQHIFQLSTTCEISIRNDFMLWLVFMCAVNSTLIPKAGPSQWSFSAFATLQATLALKHWDDVRQVLRKYLYLEGMEHLLKSPSINNLTIYPQQEFVNLIGNKFWGST